MKIRYKKLPDLLDPTQYNYYPYLQVAIRYEEGSAQKLLALVDSGAIDTLFPAPLGEALGIDVLTGSKKVYFGIGGHSAVGYRHDCSLQVAGFPAWATMTVSFVDTIKVPLLGQSGFFQHYQVIFERFRNQFEVYPRMEALIRNRRIGGKR